MVDSEDKSGETHDQIRRLFADITGQLEVAHESAVGGQAVGLSDVERTDLLANLRKSMRCASSLADRAEALLSKIR